jgi:hypothetical protein
VKNPHEYMPSYNLNSIATSKKESGINIRLIKKNNNRKNNKLSLWLKNIFKANVKKNIIIP